jgi:hypothetical protein
MANRLLKLILLVFAALVVGCGTEPRVLTSVLVRPTVHTLSTVAPGNTLQLNISAFDDAGSPIPRIDKATYSSSAPAIAAVSGSGVVTAAAPGIAKITAALTLGGVTRTDSMTVWVHTPGVYDLTALVTTFDAAWGNLDGYRYTAVLALRQAAGSAALGGTYADLRNIGPGGDSFAVNDTGSVTAFFDPRGQLIIELVGNRQRVGLTLIVAKLASGFIEGTFGCCGHIAGTFKATHRQPERRQAALTK